MNSIYRLIIELVGRDKGASRELKQTEREVKNLTGAAGQLSGALKAAGAIGLAYMAQQAITATWELGKLGAAAIQQADAFDELARQAGGSSDAIIAAMKRATAGTVAETDLILSANRGILLGLGAQADQWEQLAEVARFRARAMGITTTQAINDITTAIGRESKMIADNLGLVWDMDAIMSDYAQTLGKTASELTAVERKQALVNDTIRIGQEQIEAAGGMAVTAADQMAELEATIEDLKTAIAEGLAPALADAASGMTKFLNETAIGFSLLSAALDGTIGPLEYFTIGMEAQRIANEEGADAARDYVGRLLEMRTALEGVTTAQGGWLVSLGHVPGYIAQADTALDGHITKLHATAQAYMMMSDETRRWKSEQTAADIGGMDPYETGAGQLAALEAIDQQREDNAQREEERAAEYERMWREAINEQEQAYQDLRSTVEAALQPTQVTALDMGLAESGQYIEKWDENARRLDAIAERGFAELAAHPDWAGILGIPDNVLAMGEEALKSWAQQTAASVRDLTRPDLLNVDAAVAAVEQYFAEMAARELSIDLITQAVIEKGIVSGDDAKAQVAQALGLDQAIVGEKAGIQIFEGMIDKFTEKSAAGEFAKYLTEDVTHQAGALKSAGYELWITTEVGILDAMEEGNYVLRWIELLLPHLLQALGAQGQWSGRG